jgi:hypothetical protein
VREAATVCASWWSATAHPTVSQPYLSSRHVSCCCSYACSIPPPCQLTTSAPVSVVSLRPLPGGNQAAHESFLRNMFIA